MYNLQFLGVGGFFTLNNYHSNAVVWNDDNPNEKMLIDCGSDIKYSMNEANISHREIKDIWVSHAHADHAGGLEWLGFATYFDPECGKPTIHYPAWGDLWDYTLCGGMQNINGQWNRVHDYFEIGRLAFDFNGFSVSGTNLVHLYNGYSDVTSSCLFMKGNKETVFFTTDVSFDLNPVLLPHYYSISDVIFHECETGKYESGVHSHYNKLKNLPEETRSKMWLYHYDDGDLPDAEKDGFRGFVKKGQIFQFE